MNFFAAACAQYHRARIKEELLQACLAHSLNANAEPMKLIKGAIALLLAGVGLFAGHACATAITVNNFSFESPEEGNSGASTVCPTSWTCTPAANGTFNVGVYSPVNPTQYLSDGTDGLPAGHTVPLDGSARTNSWNTSGGYQALYINFNNGGETVSQNTATLIANNTTYTLDVWIGHRLDFAWGNATIQLLANGAVLATSGLLADPGAGHWADHSLTFTTGASDSHAGQTLGIALVDNSSVGSGQTNFDLVTLTAVPVVPSTVVSTVVAAPTSVPADGTTTSTITVTLKDAAGNPISGRTVTLAQGAGSSTISAASGPSDASGVVTFTVKNSTAQSVTYTATDTTDSVTITQTATVSFVTTVSSFNVVEPGANAVTGKIFTKIAGQDFALDIVALDASNNLVTTFTGTVGVEVIDFTGASCSVGKVPIIATFTSQAFTGGDSGRHRLSAPNTSANAYPNAKVRIKYPAGAPTITACSGDNFAIRPASLSFAVTDANRTTAGTTNTLNNTAIAGATVHNAGRPFTIAATAYNGAGTPVVTSNYNGSPTAVLSVCGGTACTATTGTLSVGAWSASGGTVTATTATYDDAGAFTLQLQDATFAAVDSADGTSAAQRTISSTAAGVGRFVPDRFFVSAPSITPRSDSAACSASGFTYMSERMNANFTLTAVNFTGGTTTRYTGSLARLVLTTPSSFSFGAIDGAGPTVLGARLDTSLGSSGSWSNGVASVAAIISLTRNATPDGPFDSFKLGIAPSDPDGVVLDATALNLDADNNASNERAQIGATTKVRFGRLRLQNASGSQTVALPVPMEAQYWNGSGFLTNTLDSCTTIAPGNIALGNYQPTLGSGDTTVSVGGAFSAGVGTLRLSAPGAAKRGSVDVSVNLTSGTAGASCTAPALPASTGSGLTWLQGAWCGATYVNDPTARAAFGIYRTTDNFIYQRENF